jgi:tetratricopeptide (TPR) repeat protein
MLHRLAIAACSLFLLLLAACNTPPAPVVYSGNPLPEAPPEEPVDDGAAAAEFARSLLLADLLYAARNAYEDNRLMTPAHDNAYDRYLEVLRLDPANAVAQQGLRDIVRRYIELADGETALGRFNEAENLLRRAAMLEPDHADLQAARQRLTQARQSAIDSYALDADGLRQQSLEVMNRLAEIAQEIRRQDATFLINARTDDEGRWIYKVMREAVGGERLRGNIAISGTPSIALARPAGESCTSTC